MKTVKVEFDEKYHNILTEMADKEFRSIKATVEFIVVKYLDEIISGKKTFPIYPPNCR